MLKKSIKKPINKFSKVKSYDKKPKFEVKNKENSPKNFQKPKIFNKDTKLRDEIWGKTGWGKIATWYDQTVKKTASTQRDILLPELLKFFPKEEVKDKAILDLGCATGFFLKEYLQGEPEMAVGIDIDDEILELAKENLRSELNFYNSVDKDHKKLALLKVDASKLEGIQNETFDIVLSIESLVNMKDLRLVLSEVSRILTPEGKFILVINHPAFRVPQASDWFVDLQKRRQGRIVYKYKTPHIIKIDMNPGTKNKDNKLFTYTFHRPLEEYINIAIKMGLNLKFMKEIISNKESQKGPKKQLEDTARNEIPMFLFLEFTKKV